MDVVGVRNAKTAASVVKRRMFICVFLLMRRVRADEVEFVSDAILQLFPNECRALVLVRRCWR
jgi:hypothetical protein